MATCSDLAPAPPGTPLYVHLPFCKSKCHYCDFYSLPDLGQDIDGLVDAVLREARERAPRAPRTVFFGGGTPSLLSVPAWRRLADELQELTDFRGSAVEVSAECNPESLDEEKAAALLELGVPRLSIGFQSMRDDRLALFGRVHDAGANLRAFAAARAAGVDRLNVDLIYAIPGQTVPEWREELCRVLDLGPDSFSAYNLTYEEGTAFTRWRETGKLPRLPEQHEEELELELFHTTREVAESYGYEAYEVSNFARAGAECLHNQNYWRNGEYLGLGPSAVSRIGPARAGNVRSLAAYRERIAAGESALDWSETLPPAARLGETWWLGLRTREGVDPRAARAACGAGGSATGSGDDDSDQGRAGDPALAIAERLAAEGWLERTPTGTWRLAPRGLPLADAIARRFLDCASASPSPGP